MAETITINVKIWDSQEFDFGQNSKSKSNYFLKLDSWFLDHLANQAVPMNCRFLAVTLLLLCSKSKSSRLHLNLNMLRSTLAVSKQSLLRRMFRDLESAHLIEIIEGENIELEEEVKKIRIRSRIKVEKQKDIFGSQSAPLVESKIERSIKSTENIEAKTDRRGILTYWYEAYRKRFGHEYGEPPNAKVHSQIKSIHERLGLELARKYIGLYFENNKFSKSGHTLEVFQKAIPEIPAWSSRASSMAIDAGAFREAEQKAVSDDGFDRAMQEIRDKEALKHDLVIPFTPPQKEKENAIG